MNKPGKPYRWIPQTEQDHFMRCPVCHKWFDMRKLEEAFEHIHDGSEVEQEKFRERLN